MGVIVSGLSGMTWSLQKIWKVHFYSLHSQKKIGKYKYTSKQGKDVRKSSVCKNKVLLNHKVCPSLTHFWLDRNSTGTNGRSPAINAPLHGLPTLLGFIFKVKYDFSEQLCLPLAITWELFWPLLDLGTFSNIWRHYWWSQLNIQGG
jgi:hypothetical protein